jgi:hypothetical protein
MAVRLGLYVEHVDVMVLDIAHAVDVLGEAESELSLCRKSKAVTPAPRRLASS